MPKGSPSVLIIRLDAIGDALALTPALAALRRRGIAADVVLRAANAASFAPGAVRDVVVATFALRSSARGDLAEIERLGGELRARAYTHAVVATEDPAGFRLAAAVGTPARIGFADPFTKPLKALWTRRMLTVQLYRSAHLTRRSAHECVTLFRLFASLAPDERPSRDPRELRPLVLDREPAPDGRIAVQLTEKWDRLAIARDAVVELVRRLRERGELRLLAPQNERAYGDAIAAATGARVDYFADLPCWKEAVAAAPVLVAPDGGAIHVAGTIGTPVVALFAPQPRYDAQIARWAPWAAPHRILRADGDWPRRAASAALALRA